jgi:hypothetical protein
MPPSAPPARRPEIHRLAGCLPLDYNNIHGIDLVGLYLSRRGHLGPWTVNGFLRSAGATAALPSLGRTLRDFLRAEDRMR